jgi:hypothetical protein
MGRPTDLPCARLTIDRFSHVGELVGHHADTPNPIGALPFEKCHERRVRAIDEISQNMHVTAIVHSSDFDAWNEGDPRRGRRGLDFWKGRHGVVIGDAHGPDAGAPREIDKDSRLTEAIRRGCMKMEIDDVRRRHAVSR